MEGVCIKGEDIALTDNKNSTKQRKKLKTWYKGKDWHDLLWAKSKQKSQWLKQKKDLFLWHNEKSRGRQIEKEIKNSGSISWARVSLTVKVTS